MTHEEGPTCFLVAAKRQRWLDLLSNRRRRRKALQDLNHFRDLDPAFAEAVPPTMRAGDIAVTLRRLGAPPECYVVSADPTLDGRTINLEEALSRIVACGIGARALVSCVPGRIGYYEGEAPNDRYFLRCAVPATNKPSG